MDVPRTVKKQNVAASEKGDVRELLSRAVKSHFHVPPAGTEKFSRTRHSRVLTALCLIIRKNKNRQLEFRMVLKFTKYGIRRPLCRINDDETDLDLFMFPRFFTDPAENAGIRDLMQPNMRDFQPGPVGFIMQTFAAFDRGKPRSGIQKNKQDLDDQNKITK